MTYQYGTQALPSQPQQFTYSNTFIQGLPEYKYTKLKAIRGEMRLISLYPASYDQPEIDCEIITRTIPARSSNDNGKDTAKAKPEANGRSKRRKGKRKASQANGSANGGEAGSARPANGTSTNSQGTNANVSREADAGRSHNTAANGDIADRAAPGSSTAHAQAPSANGNLNSSAHQNGSAQYVAAQDPVIQNGILQNGGLQNGTNTAAGHVSKSKEEDSKPQNISESDYDIPEITEPYEAMSWTWNNDEPVQINENLRIHEKNQAYRFTVSANLAAALRHLRLPTLKRLLWCDAVCINQKDNDERNEQVPQMISIYGAAKNVCIWLGPSDESTKMAIEFIPEVLDLWKFDKLCENLKKSKHWVSFINLLKRKWFSRRWVIQEIALAREAIIYCGRYSIDWPSFADAVALFVEVESATHRLSEVMKKDQSTDHIPDFFGDVPALGAARLVDATSNLFRSMGTGKKEPILSLEYLVSVFSVFEASQPRDMIYALLAIARDTRPQTDRQIADIETAGLENLNFRSKRRLFGILEKFSRQDAYPVNYNAPTIQVYKEFIEFTIERAADYRALDIIVRPWAPIIEKDLDRRALGDTDMYDVATVPAYRMGGKDYIKLPSWMSSNQGGAYQMKDHPTAGRRMERRNADPLVGQPSFGISSLGQRSYSAAGTTKVTKPIFKKRGGTYSMFVKGFVLDEVKLTMDRAQFADLPVTWLSVGNWKDTNEDPPEEFWRTLVADRGKDGRNAPPYYPRACKEAFLKGWGDAYSTRQLIHESRCTIVAEFLRRVQEVIWNRRLMTTRTKRLGLVHEGAQPGDKICILYGCSVPVILRRFNKTMDMMKQDEEDTKTNQLEKAVIYCQQTVRWRRMLKRQREEQRRKALANSSAGARHEEVSKTVGRYANSRGTQTGPPPMTQEDHMQPMPAGPTRGRPPGTASQSQPPNRQTATPVGGRQQLSVTQPNSPSGPYPRHPSFARSLTPETRLGLQHTAFSRASSSSRAESPAQAPDEDPPTRSETWIPSHESNTHTGTHAAMDENFDYEDRGAQPDTRNMEASTASLEAAGQPFIDENPILQPDDQGDMPAPQLEDDTPQDQQTQANGNASATSEQNGENKKRAAETPSERRKRLRKMIKDKTDEAEYWVVIGECYVHGMMNGEALHEQAMHSEGKYLRTKFFELR